MKYNDKENDFQGFKPLCAKRGATAPQGAANGALGNNAKSSGIISEEIHMPRALGLKSAASLLDHVDPSTGEITSFQKNTFGELSEALDYDKVITERYMLLSGVRYLMPVSRTAKCNRLSSGCDISVLKSVEFNKTSYSGLQTCGSPWACPCCSSKISERRKLEVIQAQESHIKSGGSLYFITLTFRHTKEEDLKTLRLKQSKALTVLRASRDYQKYKKLIGYSGLIRALEVTWGQSNGWHPHTHEIVFSDSKVSFQKIKRALFPAWVKACEKAGLAAPSFARGIDVRGGDKAAAYINKYGNELTKSHIKKARGDRFSPFDLLRSYFYDDVKLHGAKFVEFSSGMQGSRQLYWSNGLKDRFLIGEKSDKDLADENQDYSFLLGNIEVAKWRAVVKYNAVPTILIMSRSHDFKAVLSFVDDLNDKYISSGKKEIDDNRIALNREKFSKVKPEHKGYLFKVDNRDIFEKINEKMELDKARLNSPVDPELNSFVLDLKTKLIRKESQNDFFENHYGTKKNRPS